MWWRQQAQLIPPPFPLERDLHLLVHDIDKLSIGRVENGEIDGMNARLRGVDVPVSVRSTLSSYSNAVKVTSSET